MRFEGFKSSLSNQQDLILVNFSAFSPFYSEAEKVSQAWKRCLFTAATTMDLISFLYGSDIDASFMHCCLLSEPDVATHYFISCASELFKVDEIGGLGFLNDARWNFLAKLP